MFFFNSQTEGMGARCLIGQSARGKLSLLYFNSLSLSPFIFISININTIIIDWSLQPIGHSACIGLTAVKSMHCNDWLSQENQID